MHDPRLASGLAKRVNTDGFALLPPNGTLDGEVNHFWNPTDRCCDFGKTGGDDVAFLTELVTAIHLATETPSWTL